MNCILGLMFLISVVLSMNPADAEWNIPKDPDQELADSYVAPSNVSYVKEIPANEILKKIMLGEPVNYSHVVIKGDISLNPSGMLTKYIDGWSIVEIKNNSDEEYPRIPDPRKKTVVDSTIMISDSLVMGDIDFDNVIFQASNISFNNTEILGNSSFSNSLFNGSAYFVNTKFNGSASFRDSSFNESAFFVYSNFISPANFIGVGFHGFASFLHSKFNRLVDFRAAKFYKYSRLTSEFLSETNFKRTRFNMTDFSKSKFKESSNFESAYFGGYWTWFEGSEFRNVSFGDFDYDVSFLNSTFKGDALFGTFGNYVSFTGSEFNGNASFNRFNEDAHFERTRFNKRAEFNNLEYFLLGRFLQEYAFNFNGDSFFQGSMFNGSALFSLSRFNGTAIFSEVQFNQSVDFIGSLFNHSVDFRNAEFRQRADFRHAQFSQYADFSNSKFNQYANFNNSKFIQDADFAGTQFNNSVDFSKIQFGENAIFDWSRIKSADFNQSVISANLSLKGSKIEEINLKDVKFNEIVLRSWNSIGHMEFDEMAYQILLSNFRNRNLPDDANECYYDYRDGRRGATLNRLYRPVDYSLMLFYGYGVKPARPVIWAFVFMAIFAALFWWRQGILPIREGEPEAESARFTLLEAAAFSAMTFLSGGKLVFDPPEYRIATGRPWRDVQICKALFVWERLMGMILIVMFAIAVSKTIILGS